MRSVLERPDGAVILDLRRSAEMFVENFVRYLHGKLLMNGVPTS